MKTDNICNGFQALDNRQHRTVIPTRRETREVSRTVVTAHSLGEISKLQLQDATLKQSPTISLN